VLQEKQYNFKFVFEKCFFNAEKASDVSKASETFCALHVSIKLCLFLCFLQIYRNIPSNKEEVERPICEIH